MSYYTFSFSGDIQKEENPENVKKKLALAFSCSTDDLEPIFKKEAIYERQDLDKTTASAYQALFKQCGAIAYIKEFEALTSESTSSTITPLNSTSPDISPPDISYSKNDNGLSCPKCSNTNIEGGKCMDCGVYLHKINTSNSKDESIATQESATSEVSHISATDVDTFLEKEPGGEKNRSHCWLLYSCIAILAIMIGDEHLKNFYTESQAGIDMGVIPLLLAHLGLLIGCFLYAKERSLKYYYGLLGLFSIAGLAVLTLIAGYRNGEKITIKKLAYIAFSIVVVFYWQEDWSTHTEFFEKQNRISSQLAANRYEYPSTSLNRDAKVFASEQEEMLAFMNMSLDYISSNTMRPNQVEQAANTMFRAFARYQAWRNYQRFLHVKRGVSLPSTYSSRNLKSHNNDFRKVVSRIAGEKGNGRLSEAYFKWMGFTLPGEIPVNIRNIHHRLFSIFDRFRFSRVDASADIRTLNNVDLSSYLISSVPGVAEKTKDNNIVIFSFDSKGKKSPDLVVAYYWEKADRGISLNGTPKQNSRTAKVALISPDFEYRYLSGFFNIFSEYEFGLENVRY